MYQTSKFLQVTSYIFLSWLINQKDLKIFATYAHSEAYLNDIKLHELEILYMKIFSSDFLKNRKIGLL